MSIEIPAILNDKFYKKVQIFINKELAAYSVLLVKENEISMYEQHFQNLVGNYHKSVKEKGKISPDSIKALHKVRIQSKALRYIYQYLHVISGENYQDKIAYYKTIQNQFGDVNDVQDWIEQLEKYEKKIDATKSEIHHVKKKLNKRLYHLIEKIEV